MNDTKVGRKLKYGEKTVLMRVPGSMVPDVEKMLKAREVYTDKWFESQLPTAAIDLVDQISKMVSAVVEQSNNAYRRDLELFIKLAAPDVKPVFIGLLEDWEASLPNSQHNHVSHRKNVRYLLDGVLNANA
jgi:hypothetical protein